MQQSSLRAVRESLIDGQIAGEHDSHVMGAVQNLLGLKGPVEVARQMKQPRTLRANLRTDKADTLVSIPVLPSCTTSSHLRFDLHCMVVRL